MNQKTTITVMGFIIVLLVAGLAFLLGQQSTVAPENSSTPEISQSTDSQTVGDSAATSETHEATGSESKAEMLKSEVLIGTWASKSSGCATDDTFSFQRQGGYKAYGAEGRWALRNGSVDVAISRQTTEEVDENNEDVWKTNMPEKRYNYSIRAVKNDEIMINNEPYIRC